jgi:hypothetical protein
MPELPPVETETCSICRLVRRCRSVRDVGVLTAPVCQHCTFLLAQRLAGAILPQQLAEHVMSLRNEIAEEETHG